MALLQGVRLRPEEARKLEDSGAPGWHVFVTTPEEGCGGGVVVAVQGRAGAARAAEFSQPCGQWLRVSTPGGHVASAYLSPSAIPEQRTEFWQSIEAGLGGLSGSENVFIAGDFNLAPQEADTQVWLPVERYILFGADDDGGPRATRWDGIRCLDWAICTGSCRASVLYDNGRWSDHILVKWTLPAWNAAPSELKRLSRNADFKLLEGMDASSWRRRDDNHPRAGEAASADECWAALSARHERALQAAQALGPPGAGSAVGRRRNDRRERSPLCARSLALGSRSREASRRSAHDGCAD